MRILPFLHPTLHTLPLRVVLTYGWNRSCYTPLGHSQQFLVYEYECLGISVSVSMCSCASENVCVCVSGLNGM